MADVGRFTWQFHELVFTDGRREAYEVEIRWHRTPVHRVAGRTRRSTLVKAADWAEARDGMAPGKTVARNRDGEILTRGMRLVWDKDPAYVVSFDRVTDAGYVLAWRVSDSKRTTLDHEEFGVTVETLWETPDTSK